MIHLALFLILIYYFDSYQAWLVKSNNPQREGKFQNVKGFRQFIMLSKWDQGLQLSESFSIKSIYSKNQKILISCSTLVKYFHYKDLIRNFGNVLFDEEAIKYGIKETLWDRSLNFLKISWEFKNESSSICLIIQDLFRKHFPFIKNDEIHHTTGTIFDAKLLFPRKGIAIKNSLRIFKNQENLFQVYNKRNSDFLGKIVLIFPFSSLVQEEIFKLTIKDIKNIIPGNYSRFGAYINKGNFPLKTFAFCQLDSTYSNANAFNGNETEFMAENFRMITLDPLSDITNLHEFLDDIINNAFYHY